MSQSVADVLLNYAASGQLSANFSAGLNIIIALFLGLLVGYERSYRGRAAGMRTYGLVCMSSAALVVICAHPEFWFGGQSSDYMKFLDPSRVVQGITTGIGFLGAGVIMRDGLNISGLTTAASIWSVATVGVLTGIGFYPAAVVLAILSTIFMMWGGKIELFLPTRHAVAVSMHFDQFSTLTEDEIYRLIHSQGYEIASGSFAISMREGQSEWRFVAVSRGKEGTLVRLSDALKFAKGVQNFTITHARN
ncbi:MAG: MgtC/SapB family protein [Alphaproteobacteria bacterium]|nr:MgtC/SapB family protein [Alphaproteobacteria bacterium]